MQEFMLATVRLHGAENFPGEMEYLLEQGRQTLSSAHTVAKSPPLLPHETDSSPKLMWITQASQADATIVQGRLVQRWGRLQRQVQSWEGMDLDWQRPMAVLEPVQAGVPASLKVDPRARAQLHEMWQNFALEMEPIRLQFTAGLRSFSLLSRIRHPLSSTTHYHVEWANNPLLTLQPVSGQVNVSPSAHPHGLMQSTWRRRSLATVPRGYSKHAISQVLGVYCQRTTRRLFSSRLRSAQISLRAEAVVRLSEHSDQVLSLLVHLRIGETSFADLAQHAGMSEERLGNVLMGLYLSGIVTLETDTAMHSLYNSKSSPTGGY